MGIAQPGVLRELTSDLCSSIGSLTNANKTSRALQSVKHIKVDKETISIYRKKRIFSSEALCFCIKRRIPDTRDECERTIKDGMQAFFRRVWSI